MSDFEINKMSFKQLKNEVQLLRDELAIMKRSYEDTIYNLDNDNFGGRFVKEQNNMRTSIEVNAEGIKTKASKDELETSIIQTAEMFDIKITNLKEGISTQINVIEGAISTIVPKNISSKFESSVKPKKTNTTDEEKGMLCEYNGELYYYNDISETWKPYPYADGIKSQFIQTAYGFELTGDVSISGDAIIGGTITGAAFQNSNETTKLVLGDDTNSSVGDLGLIRITNGREKEIFTIYDNFTSVDLKVFGDGFLYSTGATTYPLGTWDFSKCDVTGIE